MIAAEIVDAVHANYLREPDYGVRRGVDEAGCAWLLARVQRNGNVSRLFGLRFVDYPAAPPTLRFWSPGRWDEKDFEFDFSAIGDAGSAPATSKLGVPTMCIPYHADYYKGDWHPGQHPWSAAEADDNIADLIGNILRRA
jgi:hypothetical protein